MIVAGTDEAGRGPLAGPVTAAAVVFPEGYCNDEIRDSKQLSATKRELLFEIIKRDALAWSIICVGPKRIDKINIREASCLAMRLAVRHVGAKCPLDLVRIDGNVSIHSGFPEQTIVDGDCLHVEISAASILAKVYRDRLMCKFHKKFPGYGFEKHVGYGTKEHRTAIAALGPCGIHRQTFAGVKEFLL